MVEQSVLKLIAQCRIGLDHRARERVQYGHATVDSGVAFEPGRGIRSRAWLYLGLRSADAVHLHVDGLRTVQPFYLDTLPRQPLRDVLPRDRNVVVTGTLHADGGRLLDDERHLRVHWLARPAHDGATGDCRIHQLRADALERRAPGRQVGRLLPVEDDLRLACAAIALFGAAQRPLIAPQRRERALEQYVGTEHALVVWLERMVLDEHGRQVACIAVARRIARARHRLLEAAAQITLIGSEHERTGNVSLSFQIALERRRDLEAQGH